uniref:Aminopeptidase N n=1 Tax=Timema monikensis TaxID=170555 RepID=A0A7R9EAY4_9NEOP|nr:unnamed protein product [Timema monikensis]
MFLLGPVFLIVLTVATSSPIPESRIGLTPAVEPFAGVEYLLPTNVVPQKYVLLLKPNLSGNFSFSGEMTMTVQLTTTTNTITFHTNDINVTSVTVTNIDTASVVQVTNQVYLETYDFYTLTLESEVAVGNYEIYVAYTGYHKDDMRGFYRSSYVNSNDQKVWLASTHFEPVRARRAFPCFDEPALKAKFQISIAVPEGLHAISNMPVNSSAINDGEDGLDWYHFEETPMPMSTYLVAFVVSDFEKTSEDSVSIWHRPGLQSQALYSASVSPKIIDKLEEFTGVSYHLPKMDEVAVPDFSAGAMENWGLVTYRERALLFEEGVSTSSYKQSIATVIAHEFGHQWFGDLVGPRWWSYLWLNEGFATYFEFFATALVETTWRLEEQFVVREVHSAFSADASEWSHPMTYDVYSPTEIGNIFDSISYAKG